MNKRVLLLGNHAAYIYNFRLEIIKRLLDEGYQVTISSPNGERIEDLIKLGCDYHDISIDRHGTNPWDEFKLYRVYKALIKQVRPDVVLTYTIKPNLYGGIVCASLRVPYIVNITGLGTAVEQQGMMQTMMLKLYKYAFRKAKRVFCQNDDIQLLFERKHIAEGRLSVIPGSGVNLEKFCVLNYPQDEVIEFAFISRIMKEKGIDLYLQAAEKVKQKYPNTRFHVCGFCEQSYETILNDMQSKGVIVYHGMVQDVRKILKHIHCTVHPTYYPEGISNVLLESAASGIPVITTNRSGCKEVVEDGITGYVVPIKDEKSLINAIESFIALDWEHKRDMGIAGREKMEREFNRNIVVDTYMKEIREV